MASRIATFWLGLTVGTVGMVLCAEEPLQVYKPKEKTDLQANTTGRDKTADKTYRPGSPLETMPSTLPLTMPPVFSPHVRRSKGAQDWLMTNPEDSILTPESALGVNKSKEDTGVFKTEAQGWLDRYVNPPARSETDANDNAGNRANQTLSNQRKPWEKNDPDANDSATLPSIYDRSRDRNDNGGNARNQNQNQFGRYNTAGTEATWTDNVAARWDRSRNGYEDRNQERRDDIYKGWNNSPSSMGTSSLNPFNRENTSTPTTTGLSPEGLNQTGATSIYDRAHSSGANNSYRTTGSNADASTGFGRFDTTPNVSQPASTRPSGQPATLNFPSRPGDLFSQPR